jgi:phenylacetate-CoA ligase
MLESIIKNNISLNSPYWLQELAGDFYLCYINLLDLMNIRHLKFRRFLATSQWSTRWKLEQYQAKKLKQLLRYVYKNVPYYKEVFEKNNLTPNGFETIEDLRKLPILTKEDVIKNFDKLISRKINKKYLELAATSGSTGKPMQFYRDKRDEAIHFAFSRRAFSSINVNGFHRKTYIWLTPFIEKGIKEIYFYEPHLKRLSLSPFFQSLSLLDEYIKFIKQFKPKIICGSPSLLYHLACYIQENCINDINFKCVVSYFENLFSYQREMIEKQFRCKVYSYYISQERVLSAFECLNQDGMHIDMERGIVEIIGDNGEVLPEGYSGRIIATGLHNFVMPFIRYDTGDIGSISEVLCLCGRGLPLLKSIDGRTCEVIKYKDKYINSSALSVIVRLFKNIKECQFVQEKEDELILNIVKRRDYLENDTQELIKILRKTIDERLNIVIRFLDYIPRTKMGKFSLVVSKIKP